MRVGLHVAMAKSNNVQQRPQQKVQQRPQQKIQQRPQQKEQNNVNFSGGIFKELQKLFNPTPNPNKVIAGATDGTKVTSKYGTKMGRPKDEGDAYFLATGVGAGNVPKTDENIKAVKEFMEKSEDKEVIAYLEDIFKQWDIKEGN